MRFSFSENEVGICRLTSVQRETAFSSAIGSLAPNYYSWKISKSVAWLGMFQLIEVFDVYTYLLVSKLQRDKFVF